jgi:LmbE family N-acetylglucosaminyl deacetylase
MDVPRLDAERLEARFGRTLLLVVPHMDDEVLACGGMLAAWPEGVRVHLAYATDGARSSPEPGAWRGNPRPELPPVRVREAQEALAMLGVPAANLHFLGFPDGELFRHRKAFEADLDALVQRVEPDSILVPFRYDRHPDHLAINRVATGLYGRHPHIQLFEYFVYYRWRLLPGGDVRRYIRPEQLVSVDIRANAPLKRKALDCFRSQTTPFFEWQHRPNLTEALLDEVCASDEVFLQHSPDLPGTRVFTGLRSWIPIAHRLEPVLKTAKDRAVALWRRERRA